MSRRGINAIETDYEGYRFRSRTEARWAVFFDALEIEWEYEPEGFHLGKHRRYLPDFLLPTIGVNGTWLEVKGQDPTAAEERRCQDLANGTGQRVLLAIRTPFPPDLEKPQKSGSMRCYFPNREMADRDDSDRGYAFFECEMCGHIDVGWPGLAYGCECELPESAQPSVTPKIMRAFAASRRHRFGT